MTTDTIEPDLTGLRTLREMAIERNFEYNALLAAARTGDLRTIKIGRSYAVDDRMLDAWVEAVHARGGTVTMLKDPA